MTDDQLDILAASVPPLPDRPMPTHPRPQPEPGQHCRVRGERGIMRYMSASYSRAGLESWHFRDEHGQHRAFRPDRVRILRRKP